MDKLEQKLDENDLLPEDPTLRFMYFRVTGQEENAKSIANQAFTNALSRETRRGIIKDISQYTTSSREHKTTSLCSLAEYGPYLYALELAEEYGADVEKVEEVAFARILKRFSSHMEDLNQQAEDLIENHDWRISRERRREILELQYKDSITTAYQQLSPKGLNEAYCAMHCAELLQDEPSIEESRKIAFVQNLWGKKYEKAAELLGHKLSGQEIKDAAMSVIKTDCRFGHYRDAAHIAQIFAPEMVERIEAIRAAFSLYHSEIEPKIETRRK